MKLILEQYYKNHSTGEQQNFDINNIKKLVC